MRRGQFGDLSITDGTVRETVSEIEQSLSDVGVQLHPPMSYQYAETEPPPPSDPAEPPKPARKPRAPKAKAEATKPAAAAKKPAQPRKPRQKPIVEGGA